jgi:iron complex transport system substrate-binding protein
LIALSLAAEEIVLDLAGASRLAAVTPFARDPRFSNVAGKAPAVAETAAGQSIERVIRLDPDLVVVASYTDPRARRMLERCGIPVVCLEEFRSFESIRRAIALLGGVLGLDEEAARMAGAFDARLEATRARAARAIARAGARVAVLYMGTDLKSPWTAGSGTLVDEVLRAAGALNVAAANGIRGEVGLNKEAVIHWQPHVLVLEGEPSAREERLRTLRADPLLSGLEAVRREKIIVLPTRLITSTSHYAAAAAERLLELLYPEGASKP